MRIGGTVLYAGLDLEKMFSIKNEKTFGNTNNKSGKKELVSRERFIKEVATYSIVRDRVLFKQRFDHDWDLITEAETVQSVEDGNLIVDYDSDDFDPTTGMRWKKDSKLWKITEKSLRTLFDWVLKDAVHMVSNREKAFHAQLVKLLGDITLKELQMVKAEKEKFWQEERSRKMAAERRVMQDGSPGGRLAKTKKPADVTVNSPVRSSPEAIMKTTRKSLAPRSVVGKTPQERNWNQSPRDVSMSPDTKDDTDLDAVTFFFFFFLFFFSLFFFFLFFFKYLI